MMRRHVVSTSNHFGRKMSYLHIFSRYKAISVLFLSILFYSCSEPTEKLDYIEPELVYIDKNLDVVLCKMIYAWNDCLDSTYYTDLTPYYIGKYEITNEEYSKFVDGGGYEKRKYWTDEGWKVRSDSNWTKPLYWSSGKFGWKDDPYSNVIDAPVHAISFYEAEAYCKWLSTETGKDYHLPNTPQWVRAAKGPLPGTLYPWGDEFDGTKAHYAIETIKGPTKLVSVRSYPQGRSEDSSYHMVGNVEEYVYCSIFPDLIGFESGPYAVRALYYSLYLSYPDIEPGVSNRVFNFTFGYTRRFMRGFRICISQI